MPEGAAHVALVNLLLSSLSERSEQIAIFTDRAGESVDRRSPKIGGFVPDVYAVGVSSSDLRIVGEAKSGKDFRSSHTEPQLRAFLSHLAIFEKSLFMIAVPFPTLPAATALIERLLTEQMSHVRIVALAPFVTHVVRVGSMS